MIHRLAIAPAAGHEAAGNNGPLRNRINLRVGGFEGSHYQQPSLEIGGVSDRGNGDVDPVAGLGKGRKIRGNQRGGYVMHQNGGRSDAHAHPGQQIGQALHGEDRLLFIARSIEADDKSIAQELVVADALDGDQAPERSCRRDTRLEHIRGERDEQKAVGHEIRKAIAPEEYGRG